MIEVELPDLRGRQEDIVALAAQFMETCATQLDMPALELDDETLVKLSRYHWPGNVRELRNLVECAIVSGNFPAEFAGQGAVSGDRALEDLERVTQRHILNVLDRCDGNRAEAARRLGVSRKTVDRKIAAWMSD